MNAATLLLKRRAANYLTTVLALSPVGYWRLGETVGTTGSSSVIDASGNGRHGTPTNVTFGTAGAIANDADTAATFNGTSSRIAVPTAAVSLNEGSVAMWAKPTYAGAGDGVSHHYFDSQGARHAFFHESSSITIYNDARTRVFTTTGLWSANTWIHLVFVYRKSDNTQLLYLNGASVSGGAASGTWGSTALGTNAVIGANHSQSGVFFPGVIDEVATFGRILTAAEILAIYTKGIGLA